MYMCMMHVVHEVMLSCQPSSAFRKQMPPVEYYLHKSFFSVCFVGFENEVLIESLENNSLIGCWLLAVPVSNYVVHGSCDCFHKNGICCM